jgi:transcriptional regulator with PAS, ATPase and Fis domain
VLNRKNREIPISISAAVLKDTDGNVIGGVETFRDLTVETRLKQEISGKYRLGDIVSKNARMQEIFAIVPDIAESSASVLIRGATGTGKEMLASAIHQMGPRRDKPLVKVNCGALPDTLLESELFGYVKGAFTDAYRDKPGRFSLADGGTMFLDEVGDMSPAVQVKLLRVLQDRRFEPLGSNKTVSVDVRIIAATNRDLRDLMSKGRFREDLYYRINVVHIDLPPLCERMEDVPLLIDYFLEKYNGITDRHIEHVSPEAIDLLMRYPYPGNIRELEHIVEHAFILCRDDAILPQHLPREVIDHVTKTPPSGDDEAAESPLDAGERQTLVSVLQRHGWNRQAAARELGVSRSTLWRKMKRHGIAERGPGRRISAT